MRAHKKQNSENRELSLQSTISLLTAIALFCCLCPLVIGKGRSREPQCTQEIIQRKKPKKKIHKEWNTGLVPTFACMGIILIIITNTLIADHQRGLRLSNDWCTPRKGLKSNAKDLKNELTLIQQPTEGWLDLWLERKWVDCLFKKKLKTLLRI